MNRERYNEEYKGNWKKYLEDNKFQEVLTVATAMQERGKLSEEEIASLLQPEEHCQMKHKVDYILNVMWSLRLTDGSLEWKGN